MAEWNIEPIHNEDKDEVIRLMIQNWGSEVMVVYGESFHLTEYVFEANPPKQAD